MLSACEGLIRERRPELTNAGCLRFTKHFPISKSIQMNSISIGASRVGPGQAPFIIAEMSGNHNQSLDRAMDIVEAAAESGAHALKLQTYTADTMTLNIGNGEFVVEDPAELWTGKSLHQLYQEAYTPWEWHKQIFDRCAKLGMVCFSSPFDASSVDFLEELDVPVYKIASFENTDLPLLRKVAATGKPIIMSTGMASIAELEESVKTLRESGCEDLILLKCTSTYPATPRDTNLLTIPHMREMFGTQVGLSDHTMGVGVSIGATALGATVIEKHFTLARADGGVDSAFSIEPPELKALVVESERVWQAMGGVHYGPTAAESSMTKYRRSLYVAADLKAGDVLMEENLRVIRPGLGLAPKYLEIAIGKRVSCDVSKGTPLTWDILLTGDGSAD